MGILHDEELQLIFSKIDRSTDKGRRDYAIFLLAVRTGMRASDISGLKLSDICWTEKTIRVVQKKTKVTLLKSRTFSDTMEWASSTPACSRKYRNCRIIIISGRTVPPVLYGKQT